MACLATDYFNVGAVHDNDLRPPLHFAYQKGHLDGVRCFLSIPGTKKCIKYFIGKTLLYYAVCGRNSLESYVIWKPSYERENIGRKSGCDVVNCLVQYSATNACTRSINGCTAQHTLRFGGTMCFVIYSSIASDILHVESDASYLSESKARSRVAGYYYLSNNTKNNTAFANADYVAMHNGYNDKSV